MAIIPFGKHKGKQLADCPKDYLQWLLNPQTKSGVFKVNPAIQEEARRILGDEIRAHTLQNSFKTGAPAAGFEKENVLKIFDEMLAFLKSRRDKIAKM